MEWARASEMFSNPKVFAGRIDAHDILQGEIGDCYFMSAMASCAEVPKRIKELFLTRQVNTAGIYLLSLYVNGQKTPVIVDDYFPSRDNSPVMA